MGQWEVIRDQLGSVGFVGARWGGGRGGSVGLSSCQWGTLHILLCNIFLTYALLLF